MTLHPVPKPTRQPRRLPKPGPSKRSAKSGGHLFPRHVSLSRRSFIRAQRCIATGRRTGEWVTAQPWMPDTLKQLCPYKALVTAAHVKPGRGAAGLDAGNLVPLEWKCHEWAGQIGWPTFRRKLGLMPIAELAQLFETRFQAANANACRNAP